jgi:hypothetical protein
MLLSICCRHASPHELYQLPAVLTLELAPPNDLFVTDENLSKLLCKQGLNKKEDFFFA